MFGLPSQRRTDQHEPAECGDQAGHGRQQVDLDRKPQQPLEAGITMRGEMLDTIADDRLP